jgi:hypothetical protein
MPEENSVNEPTNFKGDPEKFDSEVSKAMERLDHIHVGGVCVKNRFGERCASKGNPANDDTRHPDTEHLMLMLRPNPNLQGRMALIAKDFEDLAIDLIMDLEDGPELTAGLRKLLEAKDCFVRAAVFGPKHGR